MIPQVNSPRRRSDLSLPGMTGQVLSGVSPLIAARYQILVMCMIFGARGLLPPASCGFGAPSPRVSGALLSASRYPKCQRSK